MDVPTGILLALAVDVAALLGGCVHNLRHRQDCAFAVGP